ncbi:MAG: type II toxin-antitoxin system RelE/ParE family toxin [Gammaproteobacteria bacterium]|jgi:phage-related protein|nr:type II toxin-antitoxin system RelE/ParE family toxin [Gammaproteobacteria bacterium]
MKELKFAGSTLADIRAFPLEVRQDAGYQLSQVQLGFEPSDWKPMTSIASGVREIRIHRKGEFRVIYITMLHDAVYVLHAFQKKARKTPKRVIDVAKARLKLILDKQG